MGSITAVMGVLLADPKGQVEVDHPGEDQSMWSLRVNANLMTHMNHNQFIF